MKHRILALGALAVLAMAGCKPEQKETAFTLKGESLPAEYNGTYGYLYESGNREAIDSVQITDGAFTYVIDNPEATTIRAIKLGKKTIKFIPEVGTVKIVTDTDSESFKVVPTDSLGLNAKMIAFNKEAKEALAPVEKEYQQLANDYTAKKKANSFAQGEEELLRNKLDSIGKVYMKINNDIAERLYNDNKDNALGVYAFQNIEFDNDSLFVVKYDEASNNVKEEKTLKARYDMIKTAMATRAGAKYVDFTIDNGQGQTAKLSDYLQDNRYLLVDFWASWCGPCRAAMPHLADINKNHAKTIRVLSIGVWEGSIEDNEAAKKELNMTWETLFDKEGEGPKAYGVQGIPTLILIAPDGTIAVRSHNPADIDEKIKELKL